MNQAQALEIAGFLLLGMGAGTLYFALLRYSVGRFVHHGTALQAVPLLLARVGTAIAAFWFAAQAGPWPLLAAGAGFLAARSVFLLFAARGA